MSAPDPETWHEIADVGPDGPFPAAARVAGRDVLIVKTLDGLRAVERSCPHQDADLLEGLVVDGGRAILCTRHGYTFRLSDGKGTNCPGFDLRVCALTLEDGRLKGRWRP